MKKGFTLVELLAVLTLLAFVAIIATPVMEELLTNSSRKTKDAQVKEIIEAAKKYVIKYDNEIDYDDDYEALVSLTDIKKSEFLNDEKMINAETNEEFNGCVYVKYNEETGKTSYAYFYNCNTVNDTSGCFIFSNNTVYGFNNTDASCATGTFTLPTFINGKKVRYVEANTIADKAYFANATKIDLSKALFLERIGEKALGNIINNYTFFEVLDLSNNSLLKEINDYAFYDEDLKFRTVKLPDNLQNIGVSAFSDSKITSLVLPEKLDKIGKHAFKNNNLEAIVIPSSVTYLGTEAFYGNRLLSVTIDGKTAVEDFAYYQTPFAGNDSFADNKIIWKK